MVIITEFEAMDESSFNNFLKLNVTLGEMFAKDYYMHSLPRHMPVLLVIYQNSHHVRL